MVSSSPRIENNHWAFQPVTPVTVPKVSRNAWAQTEVDTFVLDKLNQAGLQPQPPADARTLARRLSFGLTGLPPSPETVLRFGRDAKEDRSRAVERLVDELLASPAYGERWGRHWLDLARYSDTKGYVYAREERRFPHAATYRNWVIRAWREDMPYDRFVMLQLAADQLVAPDSPDLAAMGFLTGGRRFIGVTHDIIDDRIDVVTRGLMGLTVQCARCHDHKYDPIPIDDYYSLYGVFHGADDRLVPLGNLEDAELNERRQRLGDTMDQRRAEAAQRLRERVGEYLAAQLNLEDYPEEGFDQILTAKDLIPASVRRWRDYLDTRPEGLDPVFGPWISLRRVAETQAESESESAFAAQAALVLRDWRATDKANPMVAQAFASPPGSMKETVQRYGDLFARASEQPDQPGAAQLIALLEDPAGPAAVPATGIVNNELFFPSSVTEELWKLQGEVDRRLLELNAPAALIMEDGPPEPNPRVFLRGSPAQLGAQVPRRFLGVLGGKESKPFRNGSGRLEMARLIADADNPLTARVMVNRIWHYHFGQGLVRTPSDFGLRAEPPSHPELLDWLARRFVESGWSIKAIHRLILSSAVYQQASRPHDAADAGSSIDPDNRWLSHFPMRRLDFEQARDAMLAVSGDLDFSHDRSAQPLLDRSNLRRTIYAFVDRQYLPGTFRTFDFANPDAHVAVRHETTVPQQALFFLNGPFVADRARSLAQKLEGETIRDRVNALHQQIFQRHATTEEIQLALAFLQDAEQLFPAQPEPPPPSPWHYGSGEVDEDGGRLKSFTPFPHFTGSAWQGAADWPGGETGWGQLTAQGGHPGNTRAHACARRWIAPRASTLRIGGVLRHEPSAGDGVRGFILSSRHGMLRSVRAHAESVPMEIEQVQVEPGDTIDFVVDIDQVLNSDQFFWEPTLVEDNQTWSASVEFRGPQTQPEYLTPWEQYAQVLLLSNEFAFLD